MTRSQLGWSDLPPQIYHPRFCTVTATPGQADDQIAAHCEITVSIG